MKRTLMTIAILVVLGSVAYHLAGIPSQPDPRTMALSVKMDGIVAMAYAMADANGMIPGYSEGIDITLDGSASNDLIITSGELPTDDVLVDKLISPKLIKEKEQ